jgi:hypothetical protein
MKLAENVKRRSLRVVINGPRNVSSIVITPSIVFCSFNIMNFLIKVCLD